MASNIQAFIHCATCGQGKHVVTGLTDPVTLRVWCRKCDKPIADFSLANAMPFRCDVCGKPLGPDHVH